MRLRNRSTGVFVNVRDDKPTLGAEWGPADEPAGPSGDTDASDEGPPPKAGRGSSRGAWAGYATGQGINVDDDMGRDDIIASVEEG